MCKFCGMNCLNSKPEDSTMGNSASQNRDREKEEKKNSKAIDRQIEAEGVINRKVYKILLLGTGGCGKTTFLKQMKLINNPEGGEAFDEDDKNKYRTAIYKNIFEGISTLVHQMSELSLPYANDQNQAHANSIAELKFPDCVSADMNSFKAQFAFKVQFLWRDKGIQTCYQRRAEFHLEDCVKFFLDNFEDILKPNYVPTTEHILHTRVVTTTVYSLDFSMAPDPISLRIIDVGGQRGHRKKWMPHFDDVTCVIFITSLSEFNEMLWEDRNMNRTMESLSLFSAILEMPYFKRMSIILFLNKKDLMQEKLEQDVQFTDYFPNFDREDFPLVTSGEGEVERTGRAEAEFMRKLYMDEQKDDDDRTIFSHITQATDTENIKKIWGDVRQCILDTILRSLNM